ncbi:uncharacterized protein Z520_01393 [Fonsecaea multimorphosa CBS 102226]|uniref:Uncharacterized protein n=1 Tax=Fonsecaea multimorphosa CBS 102226 TaxID=1442371 RepID=A0A0D2KA89_9EURO|nr:uncharacterized protein Z520_01393 [Fonsecaea multimorphosa CBS 102226]KIY02928.1 hypothetical protein Z520_01393 [Fonsecaea multimorphosa CBS 102226]OAL30762.1 hypothetical protein AYO22_01382 [Fonsecaea multimorphosa]
MVPIVAPGVFELRSDGFELFTPPTPFSQPPKPPHFVMVDDLNEVFYDVGYDTVHVKNTLSWTELALHRVPDPAITFLPGQAEKLHRDGFATGMLVSIESRTPREPPAVGDGAEPQEVFSARRIGNVNVRVLDKKFMNWSALASLKGPELPEEMKEGLLRRVWNRRPGAAAATAAQSIPYVTPGSVLDEMSNPWHTDGDALNYELDQRFVGALALPEQVWHLRL